MTTTLPRQHSFTHTSAMVAAAATAVIVGGAAAVGFAVSQDGTDAPAGTGTSTTQQNHQCPDSRCLPPAQRHHGNQSFGSHHPPLKGGTTMPGLP
jgi:hypothetical protein